MDFANSLASDYSIIDGIERVTVRDESEGTTATNVAAKRSQLSFRELSFGGGAGYDATDVAWRLYADTIAFVPKPGDVVREATGETWTIVSMTAGRVGNVIISYRCVCKQRK